MILPVSLIILLLMLFLLFISLRISLEILAEEEGITLTVRGSVFRHIKLFVIKKGTEDKGRKQWKTDEGEKKFLNNSVVRLFASALRHQKGKILHIEKLRLDGTFSLQDAAADAILYGVFLVLWQFFLVFLSANFTLEHQKYHLMPDFNHNQNKMLFHVVFRFILFKGLGVILWSLIEMRRHKKIYASI